MEKFPILKEDVIFTSCILLSLDHFLCIILLDTNYLFCIFGHPTSAVLWSFQVLMMFWILLLSMALPILPNYVCNDVPKAVLKCWVRGFGFIIHKFQRLYCIHLCTHLVLLQGKKKVMMMYSLLFLNFLKSYAFHVQFQWCYSHTSQLHFSESPKVAFVSSLFSVQIFFWQFIKKYLAIYIRFCASLLLLFSLLVSLIFSWMENNMLTTYDLKIVITWTMQYNNKQKLRHISILSKISISIIAELQPY